MKNSLKIVILLLSATLLQNCARKESIPADIEINDFIWKGMNAYYLYQDQIPDLADRRFGSDSQLNPYLRSFDTPTLFNSLLLNTDTNSKLIEDDTNLELIPLRTATTNGMEFGIIAEPNHADNVIGYVTVILPNSFAATRNIIRGEFFNTVDGVQLTRDNYLELLVNGDANFTLGMANFNGTTVTLNAKTVDLVKASYNYQPISMHKTITVGATNIAYLFYNNDFSSNYIENINSAFLDFKNQNATELIIDLRHNIGTGSFVKNIAEIATMITGQFSATETFLKEQWNVKAQPWFESNQPDSLLTTFPEKLNATTNFNSLQLTDVYIILNGNSFTGSSATELLINSLRSHINIHVIGNQTAGNHTGSITLYNSIDYDSIGKSVNHKYAIQPKVVSFLNKDDQTYENGITPTMQICATENILDLGSIGDLSDPILNRVVNYVTSGNTGISPPCNPNNFEFLYNSINSQRPTDAGVFIKQDLPNTINDD